MSQRLRWVECVLGVVLALSCGSAFSTESCADKVPASVARAVEKTYQGWRPLRLSDLTEDDQSIWKSARGAECPGVAVGKFTPDADPSIAVLIVAPDGARRVRLLLARFADKELTSLQSLLSERVTNYPVIHRNPPGEYKNVYDKSKKVTTSLDVVVYEHLESRAVVLFYKESGKAQFGKVVVAD